MTQAAATRAPGYAAGAGANAPSHDPAARPEAVPDERGAPSARVAVLGAGAWGTVIAWLLAANGHRVRLWSHRAAQAEQIARERVNREYVPGLVLPANVAATADLAAALAGAELAFIVVPTRGVRGLAERLAAERYPGGVVSCAKGLEVGTLGRISQVVADYLPRAPFAVLSGPNLAGEIAAGLPAATTVASADPELARRVQRLMQQATFRLYTSSDVAGVEAGGALKNVIALASGISDGLGLGENARASLITRGLAELVRLGVALGGDTRTFYGLAGLGDLAATCSSVRSRNHQAGVRLAHGASLEELRESDLTAEGIPTAKAVYESDLARTTELPICQEVYRVVFERKDPRQGIVDLMTRTERAE